MSVVECYTSQNGFRALTQILVENIVSILFQRCKETVWNRFWEHLGKIWNRMTIMYTNIILLFNHCFIVLNSGRLKHRLDMSRYFSQHCITLRLSLECCITTLRSFFTAMWLSLQRCITMLRFYLQRCNCCECCITTLRLLRMFLQCCITKLQLFQMFLLCCNCCKWYVISSFFNLCCISENSPTA